MRRLWAYMPFLATCFQIFVSDIRYQSKLKFVAELEQTAIDALKTVRVSLCFSDSLGSGAWNVQTSAKHESEIQEKNVCLAETTARREKNEINDRH